MINTENYIDFTEEFLNKFPNEFIPVKTPSFKMTLDFGNKGKLETLKYVRTHMFCPNQCIENFEIDLELLTELFHFVKSKFGNFIYSIQIDKRDGCRIATLDGTLGKRLIFIRMC